MAYWKKLGLAALPCLSLIAVRTGLSPTAEQRPIQFTNVTPDFDNDGFMDPVVANNNDPPLPLHKGGGNGNHFVSFKLAGTKSNRDAMGAYVRLTAGETTQVHEIAGETVISRTVTCGHTSDLAPPPRLKGWKSVGAERARANLP